MDLSIDKLTQVNAFRETVCNNDCHKCDLHSKISHKGYYPVVSRGNGRVMMVGLAPGSEEHIHQKPFQGGIGTITQNEFQTHVGLDLDFDCYLTNLIKCHPEDFDRFKSEQKRKCSMYLAKEIELVDPLIVIFFGKDVFKSVGYEEDFKGFGVPFKGQLFGFNRWIFVMNNPGILMRDASQYKPFRAQLRNLAKWLDTEYNFYDTRGIPKPKMAENGERIYRLVDSTEKVNEMITEIEETTETTELPYVALDTETTGLDLFAQDFKIVGVSLAANGGTGYYLPIGHRNPPRALVRKEIVQLTKLQVTKTLMHIYDKMNLIPIFHNYAYDYRVIGQQLRIFFDEINPANNIWYHDSMILAYLADENDRMGLKDQTFMRFSYKPLSFKDVAEGKKFQYAPMDKATKYAADDAINTWKLFTKLREEVHQISVKRTDSLLLGRIYPVELNIARIMANAQMTGMRLDVDYLKKLETRLQAEARELHDKLDGICNVIDHTSSYQLSRLMDSIFGDDDKARKSFDAQYGWAADEDHLKLLKEFLNKESGGFRWTAEKLEQYVDTLLTYRRVTKMLSTYVSMKDKAVKDEGGTFIIHGEFKTVGTSSGRMSSNKPNLQNLPREAPKAPDKCSHCGETDMAGGRTWYDKVDETGGMFKCWKCLEWTTTYKADIRKAFIARKGKCYVAADWDGMELCIAAAVSGDETLLSIMKGKLREPDNPDYDIHSVTAAGIYDCKPGEVTKEQRQNAKPVGFGALYGISEVGLVGTLRTMAEVTVTVEESKRMLEGFFNTYPGIKTWFAECRRLLQSQGYITHPYGRIRRVPSDPSGEDIRSGSNFVIQGWCSSIMKEAVTHIDNTLKAKSIPGRVITVIHDEIIVEVDEDRAVEAGLIMEEFMNIEIEDKGKVHLTAKAEVQYNLSKAAQCWSLEDWDKKIAKERAA